MHQTQISGIGQENEIEQFEIDDGRRRWYEAPKNSRTIKEGIIL